MFSPVQDLHNAATKDQDSVNSLYLKLDDKEYLYEHLLKYRRHSDVFDVVFPDNGIYGVTKGRPFQGRVRWFLHLNGTRSSWKSHDPF